MTDDSSSQSSDRRGKERRIALKSGKILYNQGKTTIECRIRNISEGGARLELGTPQLLPHTFELHIAGMPVKQCSLRWAKDNLVGVQFVSEQQ
ncbi:MAG TPA: PilZ domain-containing protein [Dongiaceae bacterium]|jgi:hypothetical protein